MSVIKIPTTQNLPSYNQLTSLDNRTYKLNFFWNTRDSHWYMDILDLDENPILPGTKIVCNFPLLLRATHPDAPPGEMIAVDTGGFDEDPVLEDFGTRVDLLYYDAEELAIIAAEAALE